MCKRDQVETRKDQNYLNIGLHHLLMAEIGRRLGVASDSWPTVDEEGGRPTSQKLRKYCSHETLNFPFRPQYINHRPNFQAVIRE